MRDVVHAERLRNRAPADARPAGRAPERSAARALRDLNSAAGNRAVAGLLRQSGSARLSRLIVNVDRNAPQWRDLDVISFKSMDMAFDNDPAHEVEEHATANYKRMKPNENLYFVGHGSAGKIGAVDPPTIAARMKHATHGLPAGYAGEVISLSCSSGRPVSGGTSGVGGLAAGLGAQHSKLTISGAKGASLRHKALGTHVLDPAKEDWRAFQASYKVPDAAAGGAMKSLADLKADFVTWKTKNSSFTAPQASAEASRATHTFMEGYITHAASQGWLLTADPTEKVHPA